MSKSLHEAIQQVAELKMPKTNEYGEYTDRKIRKAVSRGANRAGFESQRERERAIDGEGSFMKTARGERRAIERSDKIKNIKARGAEKKQAKIERQKERDRRIGTGNRDRTNKSLLSRARGLLGRGLSAAGKALGDSVQHNAPVINEREDPHVAADPRHPANRGGRGGSGRPATYHVDVDGVKYHSQLPYMSKDGKMHGPGEKAGRLPKGARFRTPVEGDK